MKRRAPYVTERSIHVLGIQFDMEAGFGVWPEIGAGLGVGAGFGVRAGLGIGVGLGAGIGLGFGFDGVGTWA